MTVFLFIAVILLVLLVCVPYGLFPLSLMAFRKRPTDEPALCEPTSCAIVISCFNEADSISGRIENCLQLKVPGNVRLEIVVIDDGSRDASARVVEELMQVHHNLRLFRLETNSGKNAAINAALEAGRLDAYAWLLFTDADSRFETNALLEVFGEVRTKRVGFVSGEVRFELGGHHAHKAEGFYTRLENWIRQREGAQGMLISTAGTLMLVRRNLLRQLDPNHNTDFAIPLSVIEQGYESRYARNAVVHTPFPADTSLASQRRQRITVRALSTAYAFWPRLPARGRWLLFGHKLTRFYLAGFLCLLCLVVLSGVLTQQAPWLLWNAAALGLGLLLLMPGLSRIAGSLPGPLATLSEFMNQHYVAAVAACQFHSGKRIMKWKPPREKN